MKTIVISDLHLGVNRTGGTTHESLAALRAYTHQQHRNLLARAKDGDTVVINGDWADTFSIPLTEALQIYIDVCAWLDAKPKCKLVSLPGNHDLAKNSAVLGTVEFLSALLSARYPSRFTFIQGSGWVSEEDGIYAISHVPNQDIFSLELGRVPEGVRFLLLHCNADNEFAQQADHSLDLSRKEAKLLKDRGITMILGHEHQQRALLGGAVVVAGNQFPTSIADCLGNETKRCAVIDEGKLSFVQTWSRNDAVGYFREVDWREVAGLIHEPAGFIRVAGKASMEEGADVVKAISTLRQKSEAFVITNAVQVAAPEGMEDIAASVEDVRSVNVIDLLLEVLTPDQGAAVCQLLGRDVAAAEPVEEEQEETEAA